MRKTFESIHAMRALTLKLQNATDTIADDIMRRLVRSYVTAMQSELDALPGLILEERDQKE